MMLEFLVGFWSGALFVVAIWTAAVVFGRRTRRRAYDDEISRLAITRAEQRARADVVRKLRD